MVMEASSTRALCLQCSNLSRRLAHAKPDAGAAGEQRNTRGVYCASTVERFEMKGYAPAIATLSTDHNGSVDLYQCTKRRNN